MARDVGIGGVYLNDPNYAQKSGPQMQALYSMMARAAGLNK